MSNETTDILLQLQKAVAAGFTEIKADLGLVSNDLGIVKERVALHERRLADVEERSARVSMRARAVDDRTSDADLTHDAAIAKEILERKALTDRVERIENKTDAQTEILKRVDGILATPMVRRIGQAVATLVMAFLLWATGYFMRGGHQ